VTAAAAKTLPDRLYTNLNPRWHAKAVSDLHVAGPGPELHRPGHYSARSPGDLPQPYVPHAADGPGPQHPHDLRDADIWDQISPVPTTRGSRDRGYYSGTCRSWRLGAEVLPVLALFAPGGQADVPGFRSPPSRSSTRGGGAGLPNFSYDRVRAAEQRMPRPATGGGRATRRVFEGTGRRTAPPVERSARGFGHNPNAGAGRDGEWRCVFTRDRVPSLTAPEACVRSRDRGV